MPPPPDELLLAQGTSVTVHLPDLEPCLGLVAACMRLACSMTSEAVAAMPDPAQQAFSQIQAILWRLEHAQVEAQPDGG